MAQRDSIARAIRNAAGIEPDTRSGLLREARLLEREAAEMIASIPRQPYDAGAGIAFNADMLKARATSYRARAKALASKDAGKAKGRPESLPNGARFSCSMPMPEADVRNVGDGYAGASIAHAETDDNAGSAAE